MKTKLIQTRISETLFKKLKEIAEDEERSLSSLIRIIIKKEIQANTLVYETEGEAYPGKVIIKKNNK